MGVIEAIDRSDRRFVPLVDPTTMMGLSLTHGHSLSTLLSKWILLLRLLLLFPPTITAASSGTFRLGIRDSFMIAHSFHHHPAFGPAGGLHGATYTCDVEFGATELHPTTNWVLDIGQASELVRKVLHKYNYQNLDTLWGPDVMTTTEVGVVVVVVVDCVLLSGAVSLRAEPLQRSSHFASANDTIVYVHLSSSHTPLLLVSLPTNPFGYPRMHGTRSVPL